MMQWLFFEQYSHEPYIAVVRFWHFADLLERNRTAAAREDGPPAPGYHALSRHGTTPQRAGLLRGHQHYTIADIALFAYTHVAHEGGFDLAPYPAVREWLRRVRDQPGHVRMSA